MTIRAVGLRRPANIVPSLALNVFPQVWQWERGRLRLCITLFPCPIFPLALHASFGQKCVEAFIDAGGVFIPHRILDGRLFFTSLGTSFHQLVGRYPRGGWSFFLVFSVRASAQIRQASYCEVPFYSPYPQEEELAALAAMPDEEIDFSDIPENLDWGGAVRGKFYRPIKRQITLRLDADIIAWFQQVSATENGEVYQTRMNRALREYIAQHEKGK